ncbi:MAG: ABC transporter substrate-binding protein [Saprospiraceae bacterium]|nr:ABC transporter substrate-binding protein [Saprospiraceae bacterium]MCF8248700.1 ABC transporter substrate-binding protein [Saprospiraceae bacterium]MCF8278810.1 ABC transporter substrate-binding protein [Bacteroidales bacterium]MCF8310610.1 ABC transporter substrate-binding protein [Saprospiraceae bacterium]MCF8439169.1 ABC transporter substrate-binding protein [Saprospiraceae bacterium]
MQRTIFLFTALFLVACNDSPQQPTDPATLTWEQTLQQAQGSTVHLMMWQGDPLINAYMQQYVAPAVKEQFGITLETASGQGNVIVQTLMTEMEAGKSNSELDLAWINGETFYQLRQIDALFGPWTDRLPNAQFIDFQNPFINTDFQQPVGGYECPWGNVQMAVIYNSEFVKEPPRTREALADFVKTHPGKFTFDTQFTGLTFLKSLLIDIAGGGTALHGDFDEKKYLQSSALLWDYLREIKPFLWKNGKTYPDAVAPMHQLFANGELWFTMSNNDCEVDSKVLQGLFPTTARAYVPDFGSIQNSHYMGIPKLSGNKAGAMVVANFLISPEAQFKKQDPSVWGDGTVLDLSKLPGDWKQQFENLPTRKYAQPRSELQKHALRELAPEYMIRLAKDFREQIINQ